MRTLKQQSKGVKHAYTYTYTSHHRHIHMLYSCLLTHEITYKYMLYSCFTCIDIFVMLWLQPSLILYICMYIYAYIDIDIYYLISILSVYNLVNFSLREPTWVQALSSSIKCHPGCSCVRCSCCTCVCLAAGHAGCVFIITDKAKAGRGGG